MSVFTSTTKRGTRIRLTGKDANDFFNALVKSAEDAEAAKTTNVEVVLPTAEKPLEDTSEGGTQ